MARSAEVKPVNGHHGAARVGRMARWQRRFSYGMLGACALTGLVWFVLADGWQLPPSRLRPWWVGHGVSSLVALVAIGGALSQHVVATWRHRRNRAAGALTLGALLVAGGSALLLLYGAESWHAAAHWTHVALGLGAAVLFPWHVVRGRRSIGQRAQGPGTVPKK